MAQIREPAEPIVFRNDRERDVWTQAAIAFAAAAWSNAASSYRITADQMADSLIRASREREAP